MKMKFVLSVLAIMTVAGCSSDEKNLDKKLAMEPATKSPAQLTEQTDQRIETAPDLTDAQRQQLVALQARVAQDRDALEKESLKLRSTLVEEVLAKSYSQNEVDTIKGRIRKNEDQKLKITFAAIDDANKILGRHPERDRRMLMMNVISGPDFSRIGL